MKDNLTEKIEKTVRQYAMIPETGTVVAAVSGGADSMAMLCFLTGYLPKERLLVCHVNHGIRGAEADRDEAFVRNWCKANSLAFEVLKTDIPSLAKARGQSEEECGREERYRFFSSFISGPNDRIATAHTKTDSVETVLFHLFSGASLRGLCGIPPVRGAIIRPLIDLTREETERFCAENGVSFVSDSSNASLRYPRNFIRAEILPKIEALNPAAQEKIAAFSAFAARDESFLNSLAEEAAKEAESPQGYDAFKILSLPKAIRLRILRNLAEEHGAKRVTAKQLERAEAILPKSGIAEFSGSIELIAGQGRFSFLSKDELNGRGGFSFPLVFDCPVAFPGGVFEAKIFEKNQEFQKKAQKINNLLFTDAVDYDIITQGLVVRTRTAGDYFVSKGNTVRKSLRKFLSEKKVPLQKRDRLIVLAKGNEVFFLEGIGPSEQAKPGEHTRKAVMIQIKRGNEYV